MLARSRPEIFSPTWFGWQVSELMAWLLDAMPSMSMPDMAMVADSDGAGG